VGTPRVMDDTVHAVFRFHNEEWTDIEGNCTDVENDQQNTLNYILFISYVGFYMFR
jgi:hypothetical protein